MRNMRSWNFIYNGNLTNRLEISTGVSAEVINFVIWNSIHRLLRCNTAKLFVQRRIQIWVVSFKWSSICKIRGGLGRNMGRISSGRIKSRKFKRFVRNRILKFMWRWLIWDTCVLSSATLTGHKEDHKVMLETWIKLNQTFTLHKISTTNKLLEWIWPL